MDLFYDLNESRPPFVISEGVEYFCRWDDSIQAFILKVPNGELVFFECFFGTKISDRCVEYFQEHDSLDWGDTNFSQLSTEELDKLNFTHIKWKLDHIKMYGKSIPLPRLTSWYADSGKSYTYSGITSHPNEWNKGLLYIKEKIETVTALTFNSVLLNWYRSGEDHMGWHADDEKELGRNPVIASVNFGEARDFVIRRIDDPSKKILIPLRHGTLLVMGGELQHYWQHSVPKRKKVKGSRFNLTFRSIL